MSDKLRRFGIIDEVDGMTCEISGPGIFRLKKCFFVTFRFSRTAAITPASAGCAAGGCHSLEATIQVKYGAGNDNTDNDLFQHGFILCNIFTKAIKLLALANNKRYFSQTLCLVKFFSIKYTCLSVECCAMGG